jgi:uncharacterized membrane protein
MRPINGEIMIPAIALAVLSAFLAGLSVTLQKAGITSAASFRSKKWLLSALLAGTSFVFYFAALSMERLSVIQPLIATSVIFAALTSHHINAERLTAKGALAVALVFAGIMLIFLG